MPRVLVICEDVNVTASVWMLLEASGYDVEQVSDGRAALDAMMANPPDALVIDMSRDGASAAAVMRAVRSLPALAATFAVALTSSPVAPDFSAAAVTIPVDPQVLLKALDRGLREAAS